MTFLCSILGHKYTAPSVPVYTNIGTDNGEIQIGYYAYICQRGRKVGFCGVLGECDHRKPASPDDAVKMSHVRSGIATIMNASRAHYQNMEKFK